MTAIQKSNDDKLQILLEWKKLYAEAIVDALQPKGDVLEIGFGSGSERIQKYSPKTHTILESNPEVFAKAKKWAAQKPKTQAIEAAWETALPNLKTFDVVFFNEYALDNDAILTFLFPESSVEASNEAKKVLSLLEEQMSQVTRPFSDQEIADFFRTVGQFNLDKMPTFLQKLQENGNISKAQYEGLIKKYHLEKRNEGKRKEMKKNPSNKMQEKDDLLLCLEECLKGHMNKNGRFSAFLKTQSSKYDDSQFFDHIITNPNIDYKESLVPIKTPDKVREGLIMLVMS